MIFFGLGEVCYLLLMGFWNVSCMVGGGYNGVDMFVLVGILIYVVVGGVVCVLVESIGGYGVCVMFDSVVGG